MNWKRNINDWLFCVMSWMVASLLFAVSSVFYQNVYENLIGLSDDSINSVFLTYLSSGYQYVETILFGLMFGTVFYFIHWLAESTSLRHQPFGRIILVKTVSYLIGFTTSFFTVYLVLKNFKINPLSGIHEIELLFFNSAFFVTALFYVFIFSTITNFALEVKKKYGPGNLWHMVTGKYHRPLVEERIFMFLDLKDSTTYAEKLGHIAYSQMIQKCFHYLNEIVFEHKAQIYQYVGDEAVLTWLSKDKFSVQHSIKLYFTFKKKLEKKADMFNTKFGFVPQFKAGINEGKVTVAEVGNIKREIAYHGDVLNTGARIQAKCNEFGKSLLVSEIFANEIENIKGFQKELMGKISLKGKLKAINIYAVERIEFSS